MKNFKKRLVVFLSILLVLPAIMTAVPGKSLENVEAATTCYMSWDGMYQYKTNNVKLTVEAGDKFYLGDYIYFSSSSSYGYLSSVKASWTSSNKKVATVSSKGYLRTLKAGTTTVKAKYKGVTLTAQITVAKKGTIDRSNATKVNSYANTLAKDMTNASTKTSVVFKLLKEALNLSNAVSAYNSSEGITWSEYLSNNGIVQDYSNSKNTLVGVNAGRYNIFRAEIYSKYTTKYYPLATNSAKALKLVKAKGTNKSNALTLTFNKKVTTENIVAAYNLYTSDNEKVSKSECIITTSFKNGSDYCALKIYLKAGKNTAKAYIYKYNIKTSKYDLPVKLSKTKKYYIGNSSLDWGAHKKITF